MTIYRVDLGSTNDPFYVEADFVEIYSNLVFLCRWKKDPVGYIYKFNVTSISVKDVVSIVNDDDGIVEKVS